MVTTSYSIDEAGYVHALEAVLKTRLERKKLYGNSWMNDTDEMLLQMIKQKLGRFEALKDNTTSDAYEKVEDTLVDLVNYALFLLQNRIVRENQQRRDREEGIIP